MREKKEHFQANDFYLVNKNDADPGCDLGDPVLSDSGSPNGY